MAKKKLKESKKDTSKILRERRTYVYDELEKEREKGKMSRREVSVFMKKKWDEAKRKFT